MKRIFTKQLTKGMLLLLSLFMVLFSNGQTVTAQDKSIGTEIVLIDQSLPDLNVLTQALNPNVKLVLYDTRTPIITEISTVLRENAPVASLHVVMHGTEGALFTPSSFLNTTTLQNQKVEISNWKNSFAPNGSILLYGCNVAKGDAGKQFCTNLAETAGVDVSASTNLTGSSKLGGDWNLEYNTNNISHSICFTTDIQSYNYSLYKVLVWQGINGAFANRVNDYYNTVAGTTSVMMVDNVSTMPDLSDYSLVFISEPDRILNSTEIGYLKAHIDKGGRIVLVGENAYFTTQNANVTAIVAALGGHLSIQDMGLDMGVTYLPNTQINMSSDLMEGVINLHGGYVSTINIGGLATVLVKSVDDPTKIVMAQEMLSKGDIVAWADVEQWQLYGDDLTNPAYGTGTFFKNLLNKAGARITSLTYATLTTTEASSVSGTSVASGGNITNNNGSTITQRGVCWSTSNASPTIADSKVIDANGGTGSFTVNLGSLSINTKYYARAFATNSLGTAYGNTISFTTTSGAIAPTAVADNFSCSLGGSISGNVMANDIAGSTPTMTATIVITPSYNTGTFTLNTDGTFNYTNNGVSHPSDFFTYYLSDGTSTSATVGVSILLGTAVVAPSALSYSGSPLTGTVGMAITLATPTVTGTVDSYSISPALPAGLFLNAATGVISGTPAVASTQTNYTVTATNTSGSTTFTFTLTVTVAPTVTTQAVSSITPITATGNGNITDLGIPNPTSYGVCWNTTGTPTITDSKVDKGGVSSTGTFTASMTGLTPGTLYHVRAYATNGARTSYGNEVTFTTPAIPTITSFTPTTGATGATVTITGTNLIGATTVKIGGTSASSVTVVNATTVTAVVASGTTGTISITTPGGTATSAGTFTFISVPTITSFTPGNGCDGTTVTITGTNLTGTTAVSFGGTAATSFTVLNATTITAILGAGATGTISVTTAGGTANSGAVFTMGAGFATYAYIANSGSNTVSVINTASNNVTATVAVSNFPLGISVSPDGSKVYVANYSSNTVSVINTAGNTVTATVAVGSSPYEISVSPDGSMVYVANSGSSTVSVINTATNTVTATLPIGGGPWGISVSPDGSKVYVANSYSNNVSVINTASNTVTATVAVGSYPTGISVSPDGSKVFVANANSNTMSVINTANNTVTATVGVGSYPLGISVSPDGSKVYVANAFDNTVSVINISSNTVTATVDVGGSPQGISVSPDGSKVYVANAGNNNVSVINTASNTVTATVAVGVGPHSLGNFIANVVTPCVAVPTITSFTPSTGATGATVTITGTNLTGASSVSIGGTSASSVTVVNATTVTAVVASGTTGTISIITPGGTATSAGTFTFKALVANAGADQSVDEGATVTLDGSASTVSVGKTISYKWTAPSWITLSSTTAAKPTFTAPQVTLNTDYTISLVVNDGTVDSPADQVVVSVRNIIVATHFTPVWTGNGFDQMNINIYSAKMDGVELEAGDEVGIFDGAICVGVGKLTGAITQQSTLDIVVSKNDGTGNGYTAGNTISFKLYDASKTLEMANVTAVYSNTDPSWGTDGKFAVGVTSFAALTGATKVNQDIAMNPGWNIISAYVVPANPDLKAIFQSLIDGGSLKKVMDEAGKTIENFGAFGGWKNNIGNLNSAKGYKVNVTAISTLSLEGLPVTLPLNIPLALGWNIISYPCLTAQDAKALVQPLIDSGQLKKVMDEAGKTIENFGAFGGWKNNIGNFMPGKGYKVNVTAACTLSVAAPLNKSAIIVPEVLASAHFSKVFTGNGTDHFNVHLVDLASSGLQAGDQIGIFDGKYCVGAATIGFDQIMTGTLSIPASCNDEPIDKVNGFTVGHPVTLQLYRENQTYPLNPAKVGGSEAFEKNGSLFLKVTASDLPAAKINAGADQIKCYPNPFVDQLTIDIRLTVPKKLEVSIYDLNGKLVRSLFKGDAGTSETLFWDGTNGNGAKMGSGTYILKANEMIEKVALKK